MPQTQIARQETFIGVAMRHMRTYIKELAQHQLLKKRKGNALLQDVRKWTKSKTYKVTYKYG